MQVSSINNVKIYNLNSGKSLPEQWLTDRKRRELLKQDVAVRKRINLIQDWEMPTVCNNIRVSRDGQYLLATGTYKPRVRCYDVNQLSMKFERCMDSEVVTFEILSDDYSKLVFLQCDRYVEFHSQNGIYYRTRIPKFGRDFAYHYPSCDLYLVGASSEVFRLNLEQGRFLNSFQTDGSSNNVCGINTEHQLFACGTAEGRAECWDPRDRTREGVLDCALSSITADKLVTGIPAISALKFHGALNMAVGTSTGQVLLYDLRSARPLLVKDHRFGLPIRNIEFRDDLDLVVTADSRIVKMWNQHTGKNFTSLEPEYNINNMCLYPNSGMLFLACEASKMNTYYVPALGSAPRWCSFLDSLTEELEENPESTVYDDYKFLTRIDLEALGLTHLVGSPLLRAYMHGFFIDIRLYHKVKAMANPFAYDEYRKQKIREKIEEGRVQRVQTKVCEQRLPRVNADLAQKLLDDEEDEATSSRALKRKKASVGSILQDDRFRLMFENPDFQVDEQSEDFRLLNPVVSRATEKRKRKRKGMEREAEQRKISATEENDSEPDGRCSSDDSSDDDRSWVPEVQRQYKLLRLEASGKESRRAARDQQQQQQPRFYEIRQGVEFNSFKDAAKKRKSLTSSLADRVKEQESDLPVGLAHSSVGSKELTFRLKK
uniref:Nucleolar protein 10 n=1 Tax=Petromyzon marinus TaxID=7757 RepID=S4RD17_PETMA